MLSGIKFIPQDQLHDACDENLGVSLEDWNNCRSGDDSSDDRRERICVERIEKQRKIARRERKCSDKEKRMLCSGDGKGSLPQSTPKETTRSELGLDWMISPISSLKRNSTENSDTLLRKSSEGVKKMKSKELNPYMKDGAGYPHDPCPENATEDFLSISCPIGDDRTSWRMKALKHAGEKSINGGRSIHEGVATSSHVHHTVKSWELTEGQRIVSCGRRESRQFKDASLVHHRMRSPETDTLSWGKRKKSCMPITDEDSSLPACSSLDEFRSDKMSTSKCASQNEKYIAETGRVESNVTQDCSTSKKMLNGNKLAAKVLQLKMKGEHGKAASLMAYEEHVLSKQDGDKNCNMIQNREMHCRKGVSVRSLNNRNVDMHLASKIIKNKQYCFSDDEDGNCDISDPRAGKVGTRANNDHVVSKKTFVSHISTIEERCFYCFENVNGPKHVVAVANFSYLMLPNRKPVVPGHCHILPMQHDLATRAVDDHVWEEIRNFKKCLIMMFAKQEKEVVFFETVMGLTQLRHCLIECVPLPRGIARQAPLYFKKAIDEAEEEWSQHNAKKLIDTSKKGLRSSIPNNFPYFHVEFGLDKGFVHVIDDERVFRRSFGLDVIRGMMQLPEEDMYRPSRHRSSAAAKMEAEDFARDWDPFDWTKQLHSIG